MRAPLAVELRAAAHALQGVRAGRALPASLAQAAQRWRLGDASRAAAQHMAYTAVRRLGACTALAERLNERAPAAAIAALQCVALAELLAPGRRHEAVIVDQSVAAARLERGTAAGAGFLNATLRRFLRERDALLAAIAADPQARFNAPRWWVEQLRADHPERWQSILAAGDELPPMTLRVNRLRIPPQAYLARLEQAGIGARAIGPQAIRLDVPRDVGALPGFAEGLVSVQDLAAQLAAPLLGAQAGERVLDACAAPGGKSAHLLELAGCELTAVDVDDARLALVGQTLQRLGLAATLIQGDASQPDAWWDGRRFSRILLDAPCSASGIVRRHPEIRWLRRRSDLATLSARQKAMLAALWPLLEPDGKLLYATCSVFRAEGERVIEWFCARQPSAQRVPLQWRWADASDAEPVDQLLPCTQAARDHDGFFYALLRKRP